MESRSGGGLILLRRKTPLPQCSVVYFCAGAHSDNRHYIIRTVAARHFIQTANRAGIGEELVTSIFDELRGTAEAAIDREVAKLPNDFPEEVANSIVSGMKRRLLTI